MYPLQIHWYTGICRSVCENNCYILPPLFQKSRSEKKLFQKICSIFWVLSEKVLVSVSTFWLRYLFRYIKQKAIIASEKSILLSHMGHPRSAIKSSILVVKQFCIKHFLFFFNFELILIMNRPGPNRPESARPESARPSAFYEAYISETRKAKYFKQKPKYEHIFKF